MRIEEIWPGWQVECEIGRGASGVVYRCVRNDNGINAYAAVKVITVPKEGTKTEYGLDATRMLYNESNGKRTVDSFVNEIKLLESLKGAPNIVSIDDFRVIEEESNWQIFIRMELLTDLRTYFSQRAVTEDEVIKLGKDICAALTLCEKNNIVHRDIKPENIFVSRFGDFKIGDFGIAKHRDNTMGTVAFKGTYNYIAPETVREFRNDVRSDMYSLGLVMYELLSGRLPFVEAVSYGATGRTPKEQALSRRLSGEQFPPLYGVSGTLNHALAKACAFNSAERFASPDEFAQALTASSTSTTVIGGMPPVQPPANEVKPKRSNKTLLIVAVAALAVVLGVLTAVLIMNFGNNKGGGGNTPQDDPTSIVTGSDYDNDDTTASEKNTEETSEDATEETTEYTTTTASTQISIVPSLSPTASPQVTVPVTQIERPTKPTEPKTETTTPTVRKTVIASHSPYSYKETRLTAITSEPAKSVIITDTVPGYDEPWVLQMYKNGSSGTSWYFDAEMLVTGTHTVIVTATFADGSTATDTIQIKYPF